MKKLILCLSAFLAISAYTQTKPQIGLLANDSLVVNMGKNFLIISDVNDGDAGVNHAVTVTATSSDTNILRVASVSYSSSNTFAIINVADKGVIGTVQITLSATDIDGTITKQFDVYVGPYNKPGIHFQIYDAVFWQEVNPLNNNPVWDTTVNSGEAPYSKLDWSRIPITVNQDCKASPPCTGHDFFTAFFKGFLVPPADNDYTFYWKGGDDGAVWLGADDVFGKAKPIIYNGDAQAAVGTDIGGNEYKSAAITLKGGKVYAIYATQWNVHNLVGGIYWESSAITKRFIEGKHLMPVYDPIRPASAANLKILNTGSTFLRIGWNKATDNNKVLGYNIYMNGVLLKTTTDTIEIIPALLTNTTYSFTVTAFDAMGNESLPATIVTATTYNNDNVAPTAPTRIRTDVASDLSLKISWGGATDGESEVVAYNVYVNGSLFNTTDPVYDTSCILKVLTPATSYNVQITAIDGGSNESAKSTVYVAKTIAFDPTGSELGVKKARLQVVLDQIGRNDGIGINGNFLTASTYTGTEYDLMKELGVGVVRWGTLVANPLSFSGYAGTGKPTTFAKFMDLCIRLNAWPAIACGVKDSLDWRSDVNTFAHFMEYIAGPSTSTYGAMRAAEGYPNSMLASAKGLIFDLGCEVWGGDAHNASIGNDYAAYGVWARQAAKVIKASPYYDPKKVFISYSARNPHPNDSYGLHEKMLTGDKGEVDWLSPSGYMGGNMNYDPAIPAGASELDYYKNGIDRMIWNFDGLLLQIKMDMKLTNTVKPTSFYESNMTTPDYNGRLGQAIVMSDYMTGVLECGGAVPAIFHLTGGEWRITSPGNGYKRMPQFITAKFINAHCKGTVLKTIVQTKGTISNSDGKVLNAAPVGCHAYTNAGKYSILLFSRDFENDYQLQIDLPDTLTGYATARKYVISGTSYSTQDATVDSTDISISDSLLVTVPKYSMVLIVFNGKNQNYPQLPLGYFKYVNTSQLDIVPKNGISDITVNYGTVELSASITPADAFAKDVIWKVINPAGLIIFTSNTYGPTFLVKGLGSKRSNGTLTVRAYAIDDTTKFDEITINISNQGTNDLADEDAGSIEIFPNPATSQLNIAVNSEQPVNLIMTDIVGAVVIQKQITETLTVIDMSAYPAGIYFLRTDDGKKSQVKKIIKQ